MKNIALSILFTSCMYNTCAMNRNLIKQMAPYSTSLALGCSISQLNCYKNIVAEDVKEVSYHTIENCDSYMASLPNGDTIVAYCFTQGPLVGEVHCTRSVQTKNGNIIAVSLNQNVFGLLKDLYHAQAK